MKGSEKFKSTIQNYLNKRAEEDELFAATLKKENKNIDECINYIFQQVQKSGLNGFDDDEIFGMAVHYYDEDDIKDVKSSQCRVVVNHHIELTEEEIAEAKKKAIDDVIQEAKNKMLNKNKPKRQVSTNPIQHKSESLEKPKEISQSPQLGLF